VRGHNFSQQNDVLPRMRNSPHHFSANVLPTYIRSTVSSRTRFAKPREGGWKEKKNSSVYALRQRERQGAYRTGHKSAARREVSGHLSGRRASFLGKDKERKRKEGGTGSGARADVLSTQSTREPDVVNGMRESIDFDPCSTQYERRQLRSPSQASQESEIKRTSTNRFNGSPT
jgi:hypothetical protein